MVVELGLRLDYESHGHVHLLHHALVSLLHFLAVGGQLVVVLRLVQPLRHHLAFLHHRHLGHVSRQHRALPYAL